MDARLTQTMLSQRAAAAHTVAGALAPKSTALAARGMATSTATGTTGTSSSSATGASSSITSSDFLTLLVSELKNQDPTQPTDPNQYITQLAQVNSLEQLISINSGIQTLDSSVPAPVTPTPVTPLPAISPAAALQSAGGASAASQL